MNTTLSSYETLLIEAAEELFRDLDAAESAEAQCVDLSEDASE